MLAIARALVSKPTLLLLDEPTSGLAPKAISVLFKKIVEIKDTTATSILFAEQNIMKALEIANRVYVIVGGEIVGTYGIAKYLQITLKNCFSREDLAAGTPVIDLGNCKINRKTWF